MVVGPTRTPEGCHITRTKVEFCRELCRSGRCNIPYLRHGRFQIGCCYPYSVPGGTVFCPMIDTKSNAVASRLLQSDIDPVRFVSIRIAAKNP